MVLEHHDEAMVELTADLCAEHRLLMVTVERHPGVIVRRSQEGWIWLDDLMWVIFG